MTQAPARMLARHGYGVLIFDRRGEGRSDGDPNPLGWSGAEKDLLAAVDFLKRPLARSDRDVDPDRIGGLGLSVGGESLLQAAAYSEDLKAVVSEGAGSRSAGELHSLPGSDLATVALSAPQTLATALFSDSAGSLHEHTTAWLAVQCHHPADDHPDRRRHAHARPRPARQRRTDRLGLTVWPFVVFDGAGEAILGVATGVRVHNGYASGALALWDNAILADLLPTPGSISWVVAAIAAAVAYRRPAPRSRSPRCSPSPRWPSSMVRRSDLSRSCASRPPSSSWPTNRPRPTSRPPQSTRGPSARSRSSLRWSCPRSAACRTTTAPSSAPL